MGSLSGEKAGCQESGAQTKRPAQIYSGDERSNEIHVRKRNQQSRKTRCLAGSKARMLARFQLL